MGDIMEGLVSPNNASCSIQALFNIDIFKVRKNGRKIQIYLK